MEFYKILLEIMDEKSLKIPDIARLTGLSDSTIRSIITRKTKNITLEVAFKMSKGLDVSLERLNGDDFLFLDNASLNAETTLLENYNKLNNLGKEEANKRVSELTEINKYIAVKNNVTDLYVAEKEAEYNFAAHDDGLSPEKAKERIDKAKAIFGSSNLMVETNITNSINEGIH